MHDSAVVAQRCFVRKQFTLADLLPARPWSVSGGARPAKQKTPPERGLSFLVELSGIEPLTS